MTTPFLIEFPADDADRARRFWEALLEIRLAFEPLRPHHGSLHGSRLMIVGCASARTRSVIWDEAEDRTHTAKALLALTMGGYKASG